MDSELIDALNRTHLIANKARRLAKSEIPRLQEALIASRRGDKQHIVDHYINDAIEAIQKLAVQADEIENSK